MSLLTVYNKKNGLSRGVFDDFFEDPFFSRAWTLPRSAVPYEKKGTFIPKIDMVNGENDFNIVAEMPGMDADEVGIEYIPENNTIKLRGERKSVHSEDGVDYYSKEITHGAFERTITLPDGVDSEHIEAEFKNGLMKISVPKKEIKKLEAKKIDIKTT